MIWETLGCCCVAAALPFLVSWVFLRFFFLNSALEKKKISILVYLHLSLLVQIVVFVLLLFANFH